MKINLHVGKATISGYNNIDLAKDTIDLNNMDNLCEASECIELLLDETLHFIPLQKIPPLLKKLITRLRKNGKIIVVGYDINECIKMYMNGRMSLADLNLVLFNQDVLRKSSCISYTDIVNILNESGIKISSIELNNEKFIVVGQRS